MQEMQTLFNGTIRRTLDEDDNHDGCSNQIKFVETLH